MSQDDRVLVPNYREALDRPLIDPSGAPNEVADLDFGGNYHYVEGYRRAAQAILQVAEDTPRDVDELIYPLVFLYRHRIELHLKQLLSYGSEPPPTHDLLELWTAIRTVVEAELRPRMVILDLVESRLNELHALDRGGTAFRYAHTFKRVERTVGGKMNLKLFADRAEILCDVLEGWNAGMYEVNAE